MKEDVVGLGQSQPDFYFVLANTLSYKNNSFGLFSSRPYGNDSFNSLYPQAFLALDTQRRNSQRWTPRTLHRIFLEAGAGSRTIGNINQTRHAIEVLFAYSS